ncbi:MAG: DUF368 domain-containing protein [Pirellulaceae bacterium]|nr:DUF368 domain-containing protein [Pirellulaceae bacterium]
MSSMTDNEPTPKHSLIYILLTGVLMGGADAIPGVSGGTVAFVSGLYERLIKAISRFDLFSLRLLLRKKPRRFLQRTDLLFLLMLGSGIACGLVVVGSIANVLLTNPTTRPLLLAAFFGAICASSWLVLKETPLADRRAVFPDKLGHGLLFLGGLLFAYFLTGLAPQAAIPSYGYLFGCGFIAICAMILPGLSGAYLLLALGVYGYLTDILKGLPRGEVTLTEALPVIFVFGTGCLVGLLLFSHTLKWLLKRARAGTLALLCGLMLGALRMIWPLQRDLKPEVEELKHKLFENQWPDFSITTFLCFFIVIGTCAALLWLEKKVIHVRSS